MPKFIYLLCLLTILGINPTLAQFTEVQKDSVLNQLGYNSVSYTFSLDFQPDNYNPDSEPNPYFGLSEEQILAKATNTYKDASLHKYLCLYFHNEKKDMAQAEKYYKSALNQYDAWLQAEPNNSRIFEEVIDLFQGTQSYGTIARVLEVALDKFPNDMHTLQRAIIVYLNIFKDFEKAQQYLNEAFAIEPYNLTACTYQVMLYQYQYLTALNQPEATLPALDISIAEKALKAKPNEVGYQHLYHFARAIRAYMSAMGSFFKTNTQADFDYNLMFKSLDKNQTKELLEADKFFRSQVDKQKKARPILIKSIGFVNMFLNKRTEAKKFYQLYAYENKEAKSLESLILLSFLEKDWKEMERLLLIHINQYNDMSAYASLISLYDKYTKEERKKVEALQKIERIDMPADVRNVILATSYLKQKNIEKASMYCERLNPESDEALWRNLALYVLKDDKEKSREALNKILTGNPKESDALMLKGILGL